jgi:hypothetical protein
VRPASQAATGQDTSVDSSVRAVALAEICRVADAH